MANINAVNTTLAGQTGTGSFVGSTSPTLVTPALGTPTSGTLTNCTGYPAAQTSYTINGTSGTATSSGGAITIRGATGAGTPNFFGSGSTLTFTATGAGGNILLGNTVSSSVTGVNNIGMGSSMMSALTSGYNNCSLGSQTCISLTTGNGNVVLGVAAGSALVTGSGNILIGVQAGNQYNTSETGNICIGTGQGGLPGESNVIRIGTGSATACYISGIDNVNVGSSTVKVVTEAGHKLGTANIVAGNGITVTPGANNISIASNGANPVIMADNTLTNPHTLLRNVRYVVKNSSQFVFALPTLASQITPGEWIEIVGLSSLSWKITQSASQYIYQGTTQTTTGTGGSITGASSGKASIRLICTDLDISSNPIGFSITASSGTLTFV